MDAIFHWLVIIEYSQGLQNEGFNIFVDIAKCWKKIEIKVDFDENIFEICAYEESTKCSWKMQIAKQLCVDFKIKAF